MKVTERFTNRVENYIKYRPSYPREVLDFLCAEYGLSENSIVADIGAGTGISAKLFLERGCRVFGVEPNNAMREAGDNLLKDFPRFTSIKGTAEATDLAAGSVDFIVAATAFHWFDRAKTQSEFRRILNNNGFVILIWNVRRIEATVFLREYENLLRAFGTDYKEISREKFSEESLRELFGTTFRKVTFPNAQSFDFEGLKGRLLSSSYTPEESHPRFNEMITGLEELFDQFEKDDTVEFLYNTEVFIGKLH